VERINKILAITGIRSEYDILYPVLRELQSSNYDLQIVVSGAHLSEQHGRTEQRIVEDGFNIVDRIDTLISTDRLVQRSKAVGMLIQGLTQSVERIKPDLMIVEGDREESIATAIVGNYMERLVLHIGGGDPVYGNSDDPMRFAVSKLAHLHCCLAKEYVDNLLKIGEEDFRVFFVGNPAYANIDQVPIIPKAELIDILGINNKKYVVLINHPMSSEINDSKIQMESILLALQGFCKKYDFQVICLPPNSDPGSYEMKKIIENFSKNEWLFPMTSLPRLEFVNIIRNTSALIGNSSMGLSEAPHYKLPVVNVGNRQKGRLNVGNVEFVSYEKNKIISALEKAVFDEQYREKVRNLENPYGDSSAPLKIRNAINLVDLNDKKWYVKQKLC
jgi:GDP/UDP-N,N'-diacetylbacillosamine 2-epimerase (hydrolysing)